MDMSITNEGVSHPLWLIIRREYLFLFLSMWYPIWSIPYNHHLKNSLCSNERSNFQSVIIERLLYVEVNFSCQPYILLQRTKQHKGEKIGITFMSGISIKPNHFRIMKRCSILELTPINNRVWRSSNYPILMIRALWKCPLQMECSEVNCNGMRVGNVSYLLFIGLNRLTPS